MMDSLSLVSSCGPAIHFCRPRVFSVWALMGVLTLFGAHTGWAQQDDDLASELGGDVAAPADDPAPAAQPPAADNQPPAQTDDSAASAAPSNLLEWTYEALGLSYTLIFFALSVSPELPTITGFFNSSPRYFVVRSIVNYFNDTIKQI